MKTKPFPRLSREFYGETKCGTGTAPVRIVTYHGTQGSTARGGAVTLTTRTTGSAHEVHDRKEGFKLAPDDKILCGVGDANTGNYHVEDATFASWIRKVWFLNRRTLKWSAYRIAHALLRNGRRCHFIGLEEAERAGGVANLNGWTYHCVLSATSWCGSTHYDPARNAGMGPSLFPHRWFKRYVRFYFEHPNVNEPVKLDRKGRRKK
jgi:hypothetical protein